MLEIVFWILVIIACVVCYLELRDGGPNGPGPGSSA